MLGLRELSRSRTATRAARAAAEAVLQPSDIQEWAIAEFRSTSPWAVGQALAALGRHHSRPWLGRIDVPTAVVVTTSDRVIPAARQVGLARAIRGATTHEVDSGHAACVLESEKFVPAFLEAVATVNARRRDTPRRR
jgi:pimeloyl-ACP methyl ester carboxylesterase